MLFYPHAKRLLLSLSYSLCALCSLWFIPFIQALIPKPNALLSPREAPSSFSVLLSVRSVFSVVYSLYSGVNPKTECSFIPTRSAFFFLCPTLCALCVLCGLFPLFRR